MPAAPTVRGTALRAATLLTALTRHGRLAALIAGLALPLSFAPFGFYLLAPLCPAVLFVVLHGAAPREAAKRGFLFGFGSFLTGTYWLYISLHVFGKAPLAIALPLMLALVAFMACYVALLAWVAARACPAGGAWYWLGILPAGWVLCEWLRGFVLTGFPWLSLGYSQTDSLLAAYAPVGGVFFVSWMVALTSGALAALAAGSTRSRIAGVAIVVALWSGGAMLTTIDWSRPAGEPLTASIVQGAVSQELKWLPEQLEPTMELYSSLTAMHLSSDLIIWPEAAIPAMRHRLEGFNAAVGDMVADAGSTLLTGSIEFRPETDQYLNGLIALGAAEGAYYKRHLVPFGEYFPVPDFVRQWMRLMSLPYMDYSPGPADQPPLEVAGQSVAASVCFEDVFGEEQISALAVATLLVNVSNDAWFGDSIAPHQHLQIARMRTIEASRPMLRATNTGVSAVIDARGTVTAVSPQFRTHVLTARVQPTTGLTLYARVGNWLVVTLCAAVFALAVFAGRRGAAFDRRAAR